jgi:hypothetical protein
METTTPSSFAPLENAAPLNSPDASIMPRTPGRCAMPVFVTPSVTFSEEKRETAPSTMKSCTTALSE